MSHTDATPAAPAPPARPVPGLAVVACPSWESLRDEVARSLGAPMADPFASRLAVCERPAARRDLAQHVARTSGTGDGGICAGVTFRSLVGLRRDLAERLLGQDPGTDPWRGRGLAVAVLDVLDECGDEPWCAALAHHLGRSGPRPGRRLATAERIARLFDRYATSTPGLLRAWSAGRDVGPGDEPLDDQARWQAHLWRLVRERLAAGGALDPLARHDALLDAIAHADVATLLPDGDDTLRLVDPAPCGPLDRELVAALAARLPVVAWLLDGPGPVRELAATRWRALAGQVRVAAGAAPAPPRYEFHASHGPDRQVEVLREVLCRLFEDDPTLEPRDVVVACCDLDAYAPLVRAAFCLDEVAAAGNLHPGHRLRVQVAGSSLEQPNHVVETLSRVVGLATDRATAQDLVDLCSSRAVAARFGLGDDDLERIARLVAQADVRWGLDGAHRTGFGLGQVRQSTWLAGVERVLVGVAMGTDPLRWMGTALPVDQVDSSDLAAVGALAEVVSRVRKLVWQWSRPATVGEWTTRLHEALDLLCATGHDDAWMLTAAHADLADLADVAVDRTALLDLGDVRMLLDRLVRPRTGRPSFGNGGLTVGRLDDLGSVAHRVVVVLGLDDTRFPARPAVDGDDLTTWVPRDPEADPRARSRQLLDDATASARDLVVVVHQGATPRTNHPVPPSVAVLDLVERARRTAEPLVVQHSLQPQAPRNFDPARPLVQSFDQQALLGARAQAAGPVTAAPVPLWEQRLPAAPEPPGGPGAATTLDLHQLVDFYRHPARDLLRHRLGVTMTGYDQALADDLPVDPGALEEWAIGDRLVRMQLDGVPPEEAEAAERLRGALPPGALGSRTLNRLRPLVARVVAAAGRATAEVAHDLDCELDLGRVVLDGRLRVHGPVLASHGFSRTGAPHLVQAWTGLLLLAATQPAPPVGWRAVHVGRDAVAVLQAPPPERASALLGEMVALRAEGLHQLVPLPLRTAAEFRGIVPLRPWGDVDPDAAARKAWGFEHDADWARFLPRDLEALRALPPHPADPGVPGPSRFENLSDWLFGPIREQMSVGNL